MAVNPTQQHLLTMGQSFGLLKTERHQSYPHFYWLLLISLPLGGSSSPSTRASLHLQPDKPVWLVIFLLVRSPKGGRMLLDNMRAFLRGTRTNVPMGLLPHFVTFSYPAPLCQLHPCSWSGQSQADDQYHSSRELHFSVVCSKATSYKHLDFAKMDFATSKRLPPAVETKSFSLGRGTLQCH